MNLSIESMPFQELSFEEMVLIDGGRWNWGEFFEGVLTGLLTTLLIFALITA